MSQKINLVNKVLRMNNLKGAIQMEINLYNSLDGFYQAVSGKDIWFKVYLKRNSNNIGTLLLEERFASDLYKKWANNCGACVFVFYKEDNINKALQFNMGKRFTLWQENLPKTISQTKWNFKTGMPTDRANFFEITFDKTMDYYIEMK